MRRVIATVGTILLLLAVPAAPAVATGPEECLLKPVWCLTG